MLIEFGWIFVYLRHLVYRSAGNPNIASESILRYWAVPVGREEEVLVGVDEVLAWYMRVTRYLHHVGE